MGKSRGHPGKLIAQPARRFMFSLARELGMTVADLSSRMSARELAEWNQFLSLKDEDLKPVGVVDQLMSVFGGKRG